MDYVWVLPLLWVLLTVAGCASYPPGNTSFAPLLDGTSSRTIADWDDVDAAAIVGVERAEGVIAHTESGPDGARRYHLRMATGELGLLSAERLDPAPESDRHPPASPLRLTCTIGRFGDPAREERLMGYVRQRLAELRGVDFAPIGR